MPWKFLKYEDRSAKSMLSSLFDVSGIPTLVLVDNDGTITLDGRTVVMNVPFDKWKSYDDDQKAAQAKLDAEIGGYPESVTTEKHEHPLVKKSHVYRGSYGCDICAEPGNGWVYHCDECGFDAHPRCVVTNAP